MSNPNAHRRISKCGLRLIKQWEGLYLNAYRDPVGVLTIGYGHTNLSGVAPRVTPGMKLRDESHATGILLDVLARVYEPALRRNIKVPLNQHQWDAMVSWVYNLGEPNLKRSTLLKRINAGRLDAIPAEMMKWNRAGGRVFRGLTRRRRAEAGMWRGLGIDGCLPVTEPDQIPHSIADAPEPEPVTEMDKAIEKVGFFAPIITALSALQDWKIAAVLAIAASGGLLFLYYKNRTEDT